MEHFPRQSVTQPQSPDIGMGSALSHSPMIIQSNNTITARIFDRRGHILGTGLQSLSDAYGDGTGTHCGDNVVDTPQRRYRYPVKFAFTESVKNI